jgi:hypothetical protein
MVFLLILFDILNPSWSFSKLLLKLFRLCNKCALRFITTKCGVLLHILVWTRIGFKGFNCLIEKEFFFEFVNLFVIANFFGFIFVIGRQPLLNEFLTVNILSRRVVVGIKQGGSLRQKG